MPIVTQHAPLGQGFATGASALAGALEQRAATRLGEKKEEEQKQQGQEDLSNLFSFLETQGGELGSLGTALRESGVNSEMAMPIIDSYMKRQEKGAAPQAISTTDRETYKTNQKLVAGVAADTKMAQGLLKEADAIEKAIVSPAVPGGGIVGTAQAGLQSAFNVVPKEVQTLVSMQKRSLLEMGDTKGIRLTDTKLKYLQENLWDPSKSVSQNMEAFRLWKSTLEEYVKHSEAVSNIMNEDPNAMFDPTLSLRVQNKSTEPKAFKGNPTKSNAKDFEGITIRNTETGELLTGTEGRWVKQKGTKGRWVK